MNMLNIPLRKASVSHHQQREKNSGQTSLPRQFAQRKCLFRRSRLRLIFADLPTLLTT